jgi:hypothetical protein
VALIVSALADPVIVTTLACTPTSSVVLLPGLVTVTVPPLIRSMSVALAVDTLMSEMLRFPTLPLSSMPLPDPLAVFQRKTIRAAQDNRSTIGWRLPATVAGPWSTWIRA